MDARRIETADPRSILVILPTWVGDFVMATPALRAIRRRFPSAGITFLLEPNLGDLVRGGDWMDECITWPERATRSPLHRAYRDLVWDLRRRRFDWAVLFPNSFRSALLARFIGVRRRIGYDRDGRGWLLTDRIPIKNRKKVSSQPSRGLQPARSSDVVACPNEASRERGLPISPAQESPQDYDLLHPPAPPGKYVPMPIVEYYADLVEYLGCERSGDRLELFTTSDADKAVARRLDDLRIGDHHPLVVLSPGAKYGAAKCWPADRFAAVADRLIEEKNAAVIITCGPGEESIARTIGSAMKHRGFVFDKPRLSLGELKSLVSRCDLLVCNDAGPRHFAKAFGVGVVTVFGPTHPEWTATRYAAERVVRIDVDCGPCQQRICPLGHLKCMTGVSVDMVLSAALELLARCSPHEGRPSLASRSESPVELLRNIAPSRRP
jgi:heptosyltransferase II